MRRIEALVLLGQTITNRIHSRQIAMKVSTNMPLLVIVLCLSLLAPPGTVVGAAKLRRRAAERRNFQQELHRALDFPADGIDYAKLRRIQETWGGREDSDVYGDKKGHTGGSKSSKYTPSSEDLEAWDELVYAYVTELYDGDINLLGRDGWYGLVALWSLRPNTPRYPPRSKEETIAAQYYFPPAEKNFPEAEENLPEVKKTLSPSPQPNVTISYHTSTFAVDVRRMNANDEEVGNRHEDEMHYQYAMYDYTAAEGTMPFVVESVSDHDSSATNGALHIKPRPNPLGYGQFGVGVGTDDPHYDLHVAGITEIEGDLIVKGRIYHYDKSPKKLQNKKKGETYENMILANQNRFDDGDADDDEGLEEQFLDLQGKYQDLENTVKQLLQRIDILEGNE